jgi:glyceraldehyde 3-phosphate dehydrogenase
VRKGGDNDLAKRASLLRRDSVHGTFQGTITVDEEQNALIANGNVIKIIYANSPDSIDYTDYGISNAVVIDNTGKWRDEDGLSLHLRANGVSKVMLTAPGKGIKNIVMGVNQKDIESTDTILSAASCTTNAITPILKALNDKYGVDNGHVETVHAYTNDQNLLDNMHNKPRRGRSAAINMVITSTGAGKAVTKVIPELEDKLTANAVRVPTPNGSLAIMNLTLNKSADTVEAVNEVIKDAALNGNLVNQIYYSFDEELVSNDIIGNTCCSVFDAPATIISPDKKNVVLYTWYDNEFGYTKQVIRLAKYIAKVRRLIYY